MSTPLQRLEGPALDSLVHLALEHVLAQPIAELLDADLLASQIVAGLEQAMSTGRTESWIRERVDTLSERVPSGSLQDTISADMVDPIREAIQRPFVPDRAMVGRLLGHGAVEGLLRELLVGTLQSFAKKIRPVVPGSGKGRLRSLKRVGEGVLGGLGQEIERQAEQRVKDFVDAILGSVVAQAADHLCDPAQADTYGRFRGHLMDQLLQTPMSDLHGEFQKLDPDAWVQTGTAMVNTLLERPRLREELATLLRESVGTLEGQSARALLADAGIGNQWQADLEVQVATQARAFIATPEFQSWWDELFTEE